MPRRLRHKRVVWTDRFSSPTADELIGGVEKAHAVAALHARESLLAAGEGLEEPVWCGMPWRWALAYRRGAGEKPWAYLIPQPGQPRLALPLRVEALAGVEVQRLAKYVRDGLAAAPQVGGVLWAQWDLVSPEQTEQLLWLAGERVEDALASVA